MGTKCAQFRKSRKFFGSYGTTRHDVAKQEEIHVCHGRKKFMQWSLLG
jgi:hypothetical protein